MVSRVEELFLLNPARGVYLRLGSLLILVLLRSRGGGSTGALSFFGIRGYGSSYLDCCAMFSLFSLKGGCNKGLWLIYYLGYMLVLIIYVSVLGLPLYIYVFVWGYLFYVGPFSLEWLHMES